MHRTSSPDEKQVPGTQPADAPEPPQEAKKVRGRRLAKQEEEFVLSEKPLALLPEVVAGEVEVERCLFCQEPSPIGDWEANNDCCPSCDRERPMLPPEQDDLPVPLLIMRGAGVGPEEKEGDNYKIRVDHLPNFEKDGHSNSTAEKAFCCYIKPVTWDYLEKIQNGCHCPDLKPGARGTFMLRMYKSGGEKQGIKGTWTETLTKAATAEPNIATGPLPAPVNQSSYPPQRSSEDELNAHLEFAERIHKLFNRGRVDDEQRRLPAPSQPDAISSVTETVNAFKSITEIMSDLAPGSQRTWLDSGAALVDKLANSKLVVNIGSQLTNYWLKASTPVENQPTPAPGEGGTSAATPPLGPAPQPSPTPPAETDPKLKALDEALGVVVKQMTIDIGDDSDGTENVAKAADALREFVTAYPESETELDQMLELPTVMLVQMLAGQKPEWALVALLSNSVQFIEAVKENYADTIGAIIRADLEDKGSDDDESPQPVASENN